METPKDLRYTSTHEWVRLEGDILTIGITDFAQAQLSDLTFVELPEPGEHVAAQEEVAVVESVKAASDVYAPVAGTIAEANPDLASQPELINSDPYGAGWMFKMKPDNAADVRKLLDAGQYEDSLPNEE
ncbi:MAG: glycine cleavage system protein GcvH [Kiritimatiellae bacterium]|nr:glycine cleavage system protein GcvH [Kiritimatiellia bacterium]